MTMIHSPPCRPLRLSPRWATLTCAAAAAVSPLCGLPCARAQVVISEIHYHPASEDVGEEYIELLNTGASPVPLNGWRFSDGIDFTFPDVTLSPGGRLVVAADLDTFSLLHPGVSNVVGNWAGRLSNSDEDIDLDDAEGSRVDSVRYADEGDWADRRRGALDRSHRGWDWVAAHDGDGMSLELVNPSLSNNHGQNWRASLVTNGTPGSANSVDQANVAPLILEVQHLPAVPRSVDDVLVTARLLDERNTGLSASVHWRVDGALSFTNAPMFDDGLHDDGSPGDEWFAAWIPAQPADTVVEFYVEATDDTLLTRTWPAPALDEDGVAVLGQEVNALYQVDDSTYEGAQPLYKMIMLEVERAELEDIGDDSSSESRSSAQMNTTFVSIDGSGTDIRYTIGVRNRGESSRYKQPNSYRVNFVSDRRWKGVTALNINGQYTHVQILGAILALKSGSVCGASRPVQVRVNNANLGNNGPQTYGSVYAANEVVGSDWAEHWLPDDSSGNAYRVIRYDLPDDFAYRGEEPSAYANTFFKATNESEDDWTDLIGMLRVIGTNDQFTVEAIRGVANLEEWMAYLAVNALVNNRETSPNTGHNDDYFLYAGVDDPRFLLVMHDLDTILGQGDTYGSRSGTIFGAFGQGNDGAFDLSPLFDYPEFEALYYRTVQHLLDTTFSKAEFDATVDQTLGAFVPAVTLEDMKSWMDVRRDYVRGVVTPYLAALTNAPVATVSGEPRSPTPHPDAALTVGGDGVSQYRYALNGGAFGPATPVAMPITLSGLPDGSTNTVRVIGADTNNVWQAEDEATISDAWVVDTALPAVRISEVLAANDGSYSHEGTFPDAIELYNEGSGPVNLSGMRLSDRITSPNKFSFPAGTTLDVGARLVLLANDPDGTSGFHTGFSLKQDGEGVFLFDSVAAGGALLDSVSFGLQLSDYSIGRVDGGAFVLCQPTLGAANITQPVADLSQLSINEWLARGFVLVPEDFVEIHNPAALPAALGGLYLTDNPIGQPTRHRIEPLSFIPAGGYRVFVADGDPGEGVDHLDFRLGSEQGLIALLAPDLDVVDCIGYGPQRTDVSQGRTPDAAEAFAFFLQPSPGAANPFTVSGEQTETLLDMTAGWRYYQEGSLDGAGWAAPGYNDSTWPEGPALLYHESAALPAPKNTQLNRYVPGSTTQQVLTYYFRTHFSFTNDPSRVALRLTAIVDDSCVIHLNGEPIYWLGFAEGATPAYADLAGRVITDAAVEGPFSLPTSALVTGDNVLAVEVHQQSSTSSDVVLGVELEAVTTVPPHVTAVVLNEVLALNRSYTNSAGRSLDWVELMNTATNTVDLAGMSLSDDPAAPRKWVFASGTTLAPGERLVVEFDGTQPASATNTGFGLAAEGEVLHLYDRPANGGEELETVAFGLQAPDFSLARIPDGSGDWGLALPTPESPNVAAGMGGASQLRINEWMARPVGGDDWFELYNPNPQPVGLDGLALTDDPSDRGKSPFPPLSFIPASGFVEMTADGDPAAGADHADFGLDGGGDFIGLYRTIGTQIDSVGFGAQAEAVSEGRFLDGSANIVPFPETPSPGEPNYLPLDGVVVNELLSHTDPPLEDAVEIHNPGSAPIDIGNWYLSDSAEEPMKFLVPSGTVVHGGDFVVLYQYQFASNGLPGVNTPFSFNSAHGGEVLLSQTDSSTNLTGYRAAAAFGASANGVSFGRFVTTLGEEFVAMSERTFGEDEPGSLAEFRLGAGLDNAYPRVGPVVFSELHYHSTVSYGGNTNAGEFIELQNLGTSPLPLYDPAAPTNTWRIGGAVDYAFPENVTVLPTGTVLLVSFDPVTDTAQSNWFSSVYGVPSGVPMLGPWSGSLANEGESLELYRPDPPQPQSSPDAGFVPQVLVERVVYGPAPPWPTNGIGSGASLQRYVPTGFGNEPVYWFAAAPSSGIDNRLDTDGDGLPDYWEREHGLDPGDPTGVNGADGNLDGDPMTNGEEWRAGTRANDDTDYFRILAVERTPSAVRLQFVGVAGRRYTLLARDALEAGTEEYLAEAPLVANDVLMELSAPVFTHHPARFYGLSATTEIAP